MGDEIEHMFIVLV